MVNRVETDAWVKFASGADTVMVYFESVRWRLVKKPIKIHHYDGEINLGIPVYKKYVILVCKGGWVNSVSKIHNYLNYLETFLDSGSITVTVYYDGTNEIKLNGVDSSYSMFFKKDLGEIEKISKGSQEIFYISKVILEEG